MNLSGLAPQLTFLPPTLIPYNLLLWGFWGEVVWGGGWRLAEITQGTRKMSVLLLYFPQVLQNSGKNHFSIHLLLYFRSAAVPSWAQIQGWLWLQEALFQQRGHAPIPEEVWLWRLEGKAKAPWPLATRSMVLGPTASVSPGSLLDVHNLRLFNRSTELEFVF